MNHTLSYSPSNQGWPSFYSFYPDYMGYMNQFFYTWKGGNLFKHNSELVNRNTFYNEFTPTRLNGVFNERPIEKKVFKTIALESTHTWDFEAVTDLEAGEIDETFFAQKEGTFFSYIRGINNVPAILNDYNLRSAQGLGVVTTVNSAVPAATTLLFSFAIDRILSVGDYIYATDTPVLAGLVTAINRTTNTVTIDTTITGATVPINGAYILSMKNNVAESNGIRGDYMEYEIVNDDIVATELFAIKSEVFKSFP